MTKILKDSELDKNSSEVESQKSEDKENEIMENEGKSCNINFLSNDAQITDFIKKYEGLKEDEDEKDIIIESEKDAINEDNIKLKKFKIFRYPKKRNYSSLTIKKNKGLSKLFKRTLKKNN